MKNKTKNKTQPKVTTKATPVNPPQTEVEVIAGAAEANAAQEKGQEDAPPGKVEADTIPGVNTVTPPSSTIEGVSSMPEMTKDKVTPLAEGGVSPAPTSKEGRRSELRVYLSQVTANSTASYIGKIAFRGHELGVSQAVTMGLLKDYFTNLGYDDLHPLRIARYVKGCYRWGKDREGGTDAAC